MSGSLIRKCLLVPFLVATSFSKPDSTESGAGFWVQFGLDRPNGDVGENGFHLSLGIDFGPIVVAHFFGTWTPYDDFPNLVSSMDLMLGLRAGGKHLDLTITAGLAWVRFTEYDLKNDPTMYLNYSATRVEKSTVGLPIDGQFVVKPIAFLGLGVRGYANLNLQKTFTAVGFFGQIGKFW